MSPPDARHAVGQMPVRVSRLPYNPEPPVMEDDHAAVSAAATAGDAAGSVEPWAQPGPSPEGIPSGLVTEGSTLNHQDSPLTRPKRAPPSGYADYTSRENSRAGVESVSDELSTRACSTSRCADDRTVQGRRRGSLFPPEFIDMDSTVRPQCENLSPVDIRWKSRWDCLLCGCPT